VSFCEPPEVSTVLGGGVGVGESFVRMEDVREKEGVDVSDEIS
jgi:hypothetical protein